MAAETLVLPFPGFAYHPHQAAAITWMKTREAEDATYVRGGILAHEMGLGKTWTTIGHILNTPPPSATLILVPPVLQAQWETALSEARIAYEVLIAAKATATHPERFRDIPVPDARTGYRVTLGTYVRAARYTDAIASRGPFARLICDEGHILRNGASNRSFKKLNTLAIPHRWILSGTPVQNGKRDFMNLCMFLGMERADVYRARATDLASALMSRHTIDSAGPSVAAMLPPTKPIHTIHSIVMPTDSEEAQTFKSLVGRFNLAVESHAKMLIILELYLRIRQFLAHPSIYVDAMKKKYKERYMRTEWLGTASKMTAFSTFLTTEEKQPTIVFCNFRDEMKLAEETAMEAGYKTYTIRGGMSNDERNAAVILSRDDAEKGIPVCLLVQIIAGGAGLNLQHCYRVLFLSSHWNPAVVDQAVARAYRMGQTRPVTVHHFLTANGDERNVDRVMMRIHGRKRAEAAAIHPRLSTTTAVTEEFVMDSLDTALTSSPPELSDELMELHGIPTRYTEGEVDDEEEEDPIGVVDLLASQHVV
jgi:SNF2 family DNA or RNA helicase